MVAHIWSEEQREQRHVKPLGDTHIYRQWRFVCTCGHTTRWHSDWRRARRERDRHSLDGQLSAEP